MVKVTQKQVAQKLEKMGFTKKTSLELAKKYTSYLNEVYPDDTLTTKCKIAATLG